MQKSHPLPQTHPFLSPQPTSSIPFINHISSHPASPTSTDVKTSHCFHCQDPVHEEENCPMYWCPTCQNLPAGHLQYLCPQAQCGFCDKWGHSNKCSSCHTCTTCNARGHISTEYLFNVSTPQKVYTIYGGYDNEDQELQAPTMDELEQGDDLYWTWGSIIWRGNVMIQFLCHTFFLLSITQHPYPFLCPSVEVIDRYLLALGPHVISFFCL